MADEVPSDSEGPGPGAPVPLAPPPDEAIQPELWTDSPVDPDQRFNRAMAAAQRPVVTPTFIALNAAVFLVMAANGFSFTNPSAQSLFRWGADFGPLTTHGQWWRVVTAAFVHGNFLHLLMNMIILWSVGRFTEQLIGRVSFIVLYLFAGIGGNLASLAWQPFLVTMGASGAIFGIYGGVLAVLLLHRNTVPRTRIAAISKSAAIFIAINLLYGLSQTHVDIAADIGGLASGFVLGCGLTGPLAPADPDWRQLRSLMVALAGVAVVVIFALRMSPVDDWKSDLNRLIPLDAKNQRIYLDAMRKVQFHQMSAVEFAAVIDKQILPPWNAERESLRKLKLSNQQRAIADELVGYMSLRGEAWSLMETGILTTNPAMVRQSFQKQSAAQAALQTINRELAPAPGSKSGR
jgi:rhomboid protease GluP